MNELELYVDSLDPSLSNDEKVRLVKEWKKANKWGEQEVEVSETVELDEVDLGTVKKKDGVPGAVAPSIGPQEAPEPTELTLEDGFSVLPEVETKVEEVKVEEDGDWDFWKETGTKIKANTIDALGKLARVPTLINEFKAAVSREFMSEEEKARYDALDPLVKQALANIGSQPGMTALANTGLEAYEDSVKKANVIREDLTEFETSIGEEYAKGNFVDATVRTASDALGSLPSVVQSMIPYVGITSIVAGEAAGASAEAQKEGEDLSLKTLGYSTVRGAAEGLLEVVTKKIGGGMFKNLAGKGKKEATESITKIALGIGKDYGAEGLSETATEVINKMADAAQFGKKDTFDNHLRDLVDTFLVGGMMGGGMSSVGASAAGSRLIKNTIQDNSVQRDLEGTEYDSVVDAYETPDVTEGLPKLSENKFTQNKLESELKQKVGDGVFTVEQANNVRNNFRDIQGALNTVKPLGISVENTKPVVDLVIEQKKLKNKIKQVDNSSLTKAESKRLSEIDKELNDIIVADKTAKVEKGAKVIAEQVGTGFETFENEADVASAIETLKEEGGNIDTKNSEDYGTFVVMPDGKRIIILNKESAAQDNVMTTAQHEVGHAVLFETVKNKPEAAIALGTSLLEELKNSKDITFTSSKFLDRFNQYVEDADISKADTMEEVLTLASEGLESGDIVFNEKATTKIGDFIRRALSAMGLNVKFKTGKDVLNFVRDYNRSVQKGKGLSKGLEKAATKGAEVDIKAPTDIEAEVTDIVAKESKKDTGAIASTKVQEIYDAQGEAGAFDIIDQFKPIVNRIVEKRRDAPNFDRQLLTDEIETGKRGIFDLIKEYNPESGVPLAAYINKFLPARAIEASKRVLGEEFTTDVTEARGVVAEETTEVKTKEKPLAKKPTETVEFSQTQIEKIGAKDKAEVETKITESTNKAFEGKKITRFGETRNVPKAVADIYANMFGLNPQTITDKTRNYQKTDAEGLTTAKQFLLKNANNDFARLPKTKDGFGKGTFLPRNVMNALYTDGKLTGTLKDYMDLIRQKPVKPIYRDAVGQTIRGLLNLHIRNRMFEDLVTTTPERLRGGAKFSKRINTEQQVFEDKKLNDLFKSVSQAKSIIDVAKIIGVKGKITVNDSNRAQKQEQMLDFIKSGSIPSAVFEVAKFQNFARRKVNGVYVDLPARGGLYYGKSDPAYQAALNAAKENDSKYPDLAKPKRVNVNKAFTKEGIKQSKENTKFLNSFVNILNDAVNKNGLPIEIAALYITSGYQATTGIIKIAAPFRYKSTKFEYAGPSGKGSDNKGEKFREEHTIPASVIGANIILAIQKNAVKPTMKAIEKNYFQVQLSKKDDTKLDKAGLDSTLFENQTIFDSPISRLAAAGINLQTIINPLNGKTIAEENGVGINNKLYNGFSENEKAQASFIQNEEIKKGALDKDYNVKESIDVSMRLVPDKAKASKRINELMPSEIKYDKPISVQMGVDALAKSDEALNNARRPDAPVKKIRVFDFDDTLARSKSKVLYTVPNIEGGFSEGTTKLKAIFMVGGPGAGKTNVGKGLQLGRRGYKVVNQDIALEAMKAESGLPAKESDYTAEQRSLRSKLGAAARKAAVAKFDKYAAAGNGMVIDGTGASYNATTKKIKALQDQGFEVHMVVATTPLETAIERNKARVERSLPDFVVEKTYESVQESLKKYREDFGDRLYEINTETIEYGKPLPNDFLQQVYSGINANKVGKVDATSFAENYDVLESQGAEFDFREFSKVIEGKKGPLFSVAEKIAAARGTDDVFILTARPADAAKPIQEFMKANGIDIPLANITGLGDGTAEAKAGWIMGKAAEGYNDFYFADDAIKNVKAVKGVLSQVDVKSKVQQAKASKRIVFDKVFNDIIEQKTGIESYKQYSAAKAKTVGASKGKFTFFTTPSAEDFLGLLYKTLGKGKVGDAQMAFYKTNLLDPYNRAEIAISQAKVAAGRDYKALKKQFKNIPKTLEKETGIAKYTYQHAIRTYIWNKQGIEVPGLSKRDQKRLTEFITNDAELSVFADNLITIQKDKPYPEPSKDWTAGTITTDVIGGINKVNRKEYLQEWQENVDIIFSDNNMNKLEAAFGANYVEALKDSLRSMKSGSNRPLGGDRVSDGILDWLNNSVGAIMFLNTRSAVLQTISAVNFVNWGDNNILKAGKAFANQKQFWGDFLTLMNSDYLLERRDGLKINVSESEIADAVQGSKNKVNAAISFLLNKGFVFTRYADSFAIASGGATFYRNRTEALVEQGMNRKAAEEQAFNDFRAIAEENQQSSSPSKISQQQRSLIGRIILQFGNTQLQYVRIQKRAVQDLVNKRGDWRSNISKIVYYGAIQNLLFNALQSGLAWALFDDDEDDEELTEKNKEQKLTRTLNGAIDSQLKGLGIQGAVIAGVKNALMTIAEQADKKSPKFEEALDDLLSIAPALGSKIRKLKSAARTVSWNRKDIKEEGFSMDNPAYLAGAQVISAAFNIPLDRAVMKINNMRNILNPATENWQKVALALGWSGWDVGLPYFGLAEDKPVLTETEKQTQKLFDLNKSDQVKMLLDLGLTKKEIRALTKEQQRVDQIIKLQNKNKDGK